MSPDTNTERPYVIIQAHPDEWWEVRPSDNSFEGRFVREHRVALIVADYYRTLLAA